MLKIGIIPNTTKEDCNAVMHKFCSELSGKAMVYVQEGCSCCPEGVQPLDEAGFYKQCDIVTVLGGDGSILRIAGKAAEAGKPILGINLGRVGYLASAEKTSLSQVAERLLNGNYKLAEHMMLLAEYTADGEKKSITALNDVVVSRSEFGRIMELSVYVDEEYVDTYMADGIVISSPTGSTAYSLSAGGPVAYPTMDMLMITPICSHDLRSRPIVIPSDKKITVTLGHKYEYKAIITVDGQIIHPMKTDESFRVLASPLRAKLIKMDDCGFYDLLRMKLRGN